MKFLRGRLMTGLARRCKRAVNAVVGWLVVGVLKALRLLDPNRMSDFSAWVLRHVGPLLREHRVGRANLAAAFPEKSAAEIERILSGVWDNLGRVSAEIAHLDRLWDYDQTRQKRGRILDSDESLARLCQLRDDNQPALIFITVTI